MSITLGPCNRQDAIGIYMRENVFTVLRRNNLYVKANELTHAFSNTEVVHFFRGKGKAQTSRTMPAHILPCHLLELRVKRIAIVVNKP